MVKILVIQLIYAVVPSICGFFVLAYASPRIYRLAKKSLQFDVLTLLLVTAFVACLLGINRALVNDEVIAMSAGSFLDVFVSLMFGSDAAGRLLAVYFLSTSAMPAVIFARAFLEGIGENRIARAARRKRQGLSDPTDWPNA